ncbi:MAG: hypothetical protein J6I45_09125 [Clostridia bacterium]|nr:hypothetical protein [Clostridia bacterium]
MKHHSHCHSCDTKIPAGGRSCCSTCHGGCRRRYEIILTEEEAALLRLFASSPYLPAARFVMKSSKTSHARNIALAPVFLLSPEDDVKTASHTAELLNSLADKGLIEIDYQTPLDNADEHEIKDSPLYAYFVDTVREGAEKFNSVFDIAALELGSMGLTAIGRRAITQLG